MPHFYQPGVCRVLAIDDEAGVRRVYTRALSSLFDINTADSIETARGMLDSGMSFDACILDLCMPGEDTAEFWRWLRASHPALASHTLVISGQPGNPRYGPIVGDRTDWVMTKPVTPWELRDELWSLLAGRSSEKKSAGLAPAPERGMTQC